MEYRYDGMLIEMKPSQENQNCRLSMYYGKLQSLMHEKEACGKSHGEKQLMDQFWNTESKWEQKVYGRLKTLEKRHPIMGITFCTVLGGILVSLIAGIILEAILMCMR